MADDGKVSIGTEIDTSGAEKGIKGLSNKLKKLADNKISKGLANIGAAVSGVGVAFSGVTKAVNSVASGIKAVNDAYRVQIGAETQLQTASQNNPYLDGKSVKNLKAYASQLQSVSTFGDEELLPFMAQLASSGRTEQEIMDIMAASINVAASGTMSLESAVRNLNKTYGGLSGELGESIPQIKNLTTEQLKNGEAVKVIAGQYKGMAESVAQSTGSSQRLANTWGDFKEALGRNFAPAVDNVKNSAQTLLTNVVDAMNKSVETKQAIIEAQAEGVELAKILDGKNGGSGKTVAEAAKEEKEAKENAKKAAKEAKRAAEQAAKEAAASIQSIFAESAGQALLNSGKFSATEIERKAKEISEFFDSMTYNYMPQDQLNEQRISDIASLYDMTREDAEKLAYYSGIIKANETGRYDAIVEETKAKKEQLALEDEAQKKAEEAQKSEAEKAQELAKRNEYRAKIDKAILEETENIRREELASTVQIDEKTKAQRKYAAAVAVVFDMLKDPVFTGMSFEDAVGKRLKTIQKLGKAASEVEDTTKEAERSAEDVKSQYSESAQHEAKKAALEADLALLNAELDKEKITAEEKVKIDKEWAEAHKAILKEIDDANNESLEKQREKISEVAGDIASVMQQTQDIVDRACEMMSDNISTQVDLETAEAEKKYASGEMNEEEYYDRLNEIQKKAAQDEYKVKMAQWTMSVATATANIAEGVTKALAQGYPIGIINGALIGVSGAVQLASLAQSKPTPPKFATGGIVPGTSYSGDKVPILANSGEGIFTKGQMKALGLMAGRGQGMDITINNSQSDRVSTVAQQKNDYSVVIDILDKHINEGFINGSYDGGIAGMNTRQAGTVIL